MWKRISPEPIMAKILPPRLSNGELEKTTSLYNTRRSQGNKRKVRYKNNMKITVTIPNDCMEAVEAYCQKHLNMSFQARMQQEADRIVGNILPLVEAYKGLKKELDKFFDDFEKIVEDVKDEKGG